MEKVYAKRQLLVTRAVKILKAGDCREPSHCSHASPCAGCPLETAQTVFSLEFKKARVLQAFADANLYPDIEDVKSSMSHRAYRQKIKLMIGVKNRNVRLGLYRPGSHHLQSATQCILVRPAINEVASLVQKQLNELVKPGLLQEEQVPVALSLREGLEGVVGILVCDALPAPALRKGMQKLIDEQQLQGLGFRVREKKTNSIVNGDIVEALGFYG